MLNGIIPDYIRNSTSLYRPLPNGGKLAQFFGNNVSWTPSDPTGVNDMSAELEAVIRANPGKMIVVQSGSIIRLNNALANLYDEDNRHPEGVYLSGYGVTVIYPPVLNGVALNLTNIANASAPRVVTAMSMAIAEGSSNDAYVTKIIRAKVGSNDSGSTFNRFDWLAMDTTIANPAVSGGYLGETFQVMSNENSVDATTAELWVTRKLNRHDPYVAGLSVTGSGFSRAECSLNFDGQTVNFQVGETVTGATSGASGVIASQTDSGATGTLNLTSVLGTYQDNEILTGSLGGAALANGAPYNVTTPITSNITFRRLDDRKLWIEGFEFSADGDSTSPETNRGDAILAEGWVNPQFRDLRFSNVWSRGLRVRACGGGCAMNTELYNTPNRGGQNGFTYGVLLDSLTDSFYVFGSRAYNGRHAIVSTDGNSSFTTSWNRRGIPTNCVISGWASWNSHGSPVDTHQEGDRIIISEGAIYNPYQDETISPNFSGLGIQARCANMIIRNVWQFGGTRFLKLNAVDHGFEDEVRVINCGIVGTTSSTGLLDGAIVSDDISAQTNKRRLILENFSMEDTGYGLQLNNGWKCDIRGYFSAKNVYLPIDQDSDSILEIFGQVDLSYEGQVRSNAAGAHVIRSGCVTIYHNSPKIHRGDLASEPTRYFTNNDTSAKTLFCPKPMEYNPDAVTALAFINNTTGITFPDMDVMKLANLADLASTSFSDGVNYGFTYASSTGKFTPYAIPAPSAGSWTEVTTTTTNNGSGVLATTVLAAIPVPDNKASCIEYIAIGQNVAGTEGGISRASMLVRRNGAGTPVVVNTGVTQSNDNITGTVTFAQTPNAGGTLDITAAITGGVASADTNWKIIYRVTSAT